jgi:hypothetical protein
MLHMQFDFILHVTWIAGTRMIKQGTDGFLRGEDNGLSTRGLSLGGMAPLHPSMMAHSLMIEDWIHWEKFGSVGAKGMVHLGS